jgi:hypothetical protein
MATVVFLISVFMLVFSVYQSYTEGFMGKDKIDHFLNGAFAAVALKHVILYVIALF